MTVGYERNERCKNCKYCRDVYTSLPQVKIRGCYCEPYKGKWVTEIDICPMTLSHCCIPQAESEEKDG